ncbi:MAG: hypothetical protein K8S23_11370 [Candidatus Cloacimonetes bacterium]|nr:hypothetical protein [Candidatus Cloacimonadota bacterium]
MTNKTYELLKKMAWVLFFLFILYAPLNMYKTIKYIITQKGLPFYVSLDSGYYKFGEIIYFDSLLIDTALDKKILVKLDTPSVPR